MISHLQMPLNGIGQVLPEVLDVVFTDDCSSAEVSQFFVRHWTLLEMCSAT